MGNKLKKIVIALAITNICTAAFAENLLDEVPNLTGKEKQEIREQWEETFGFDVWFPYFKLKEYEDWLMDKIGLHLFGCKGKIEFKKDYFGLVFRKQF